MSQAPPREAGRPGRTGRAWTKEKDMRAVRYTGVGAAAEVTEPDRGRRAHRDRGRGARPGRRRRAQPGRREDPRGRGRLRPDPVHPGAGLGRRG
ncbi:hypothetical protein [Nocardioides convexus]|uniref:hypothetical protein n=1 Tax=Nocardioides convexus TaxID=2712224 RepID=UPI00241833F4|nr:hypothetical protein [Nocardioides convexus]